MNINSSTSVQTSMRTNGWDKTISIAQYVKGGDHFMDPPFMLHGDAAWKFMQNHSLP